MVLLERVGSLEGPGRLGVCHWMGTQTQTGMVTIKSPWAAQWEVRHPLQRLGHPPGTPATGSVGWGGAPPGAKWVLKVPC